MSHQSVDLYSLVPTEQINDRTSEIDLLPTEAMLYQINDEDQRVALAVRQAVPQIARIVDRVVQAFNQGGHLYYVGAGTSGRLGVLDASECPPTYGVEPQLVQGVIAGGNIALTQAVEGAEDSAEQGRQAILDLNVTRHDVVIGISASGGAAYVVNAIQTAKEAGAFTGAISCHAGSALAQAADVAMIAEVGPEVIAGSTRMKAGTAQKLILNMITTGAMIAWGKTYRNLMVDVRPTNLKLQKRAVRLVSHLANISPSEAEKLLEQAHWQVKTAIIMHVKNVGYDETHALLNRHHGKLRAVLEAEDAG